MSEQIEPCPLCLKLPVGWWDTWPSPTQRSESVYMLCCDSGHQPIKARGRDRFDAVDDWNNLVVDMMVNKG